MNTPMSGLGFNLMTLSFRFRDFFRPRMELLREVGIEPGFSILDYGCGSGSYIAPLVQLVGPSGKIYALDIHPLAIKKVRQMISGKGFANVKTIESNCVTGLPDNTVDVVILYDTFHGLLQPDKWDAASSCRTSSTDYVLLLDVCGDLVGLVGMQQVQVQPTGVDVAVDHRRSRRDRDRNDERQQVRRVSMRVSTAMIASSLWSVGVRISHATLTVETTRSIATSQTKCSSGTDPDAAAAGLGYRRRP